MTLKVAIHQIHHHDPEAKTSKVIKPGTVFECHDSHVDYLTKVGAVRDPEERELLSYQHSIGYFVPASEVVPVTPPKSAKAPAAAVEDNIG